MAISTPAGKIRVELREALQPTGCGEYVRRRRVSRLVNALCPLSGLVVDVGGGPGRLSTALRPDLRSRYTVVDVAGGPHGRRIVADIACAPLPAATADIVCLSDVLEHVADDVAAVREAVRILRPGGHLVVHVPSLREQPLAFMRRAADEAEAADHQQFPHVRDGYDAQGLASLLAEASCGVQPSVEPSCTALQSMVTDLDGYLWFRRLTVLRAIPWTAIRLVRFRAVAPLERSSSGLVGVLRRAP